MQPISRVLQIVEGRCHGDDSSNRIQACLAENLPSPTRSEHILIRDLFAPLPTRDTPSIARLQVVGVLLLDQAFAHEPVGVRA